MHLVGFIVRTKDNYENIGQNSLNVATSGTSGAKLLVDNVIFRMLKKSYMMCTAVCRETSQTSHLPV